MDFFAHQDQARKRTGQLVFLFAGAVITLIVLLNLLLAAVLWGMDENLVGTYRDTVYLAGQVGTAGADIKTQTQDCLDKIDALLAEAGSDKSHLLQQIEGTLHQVLK